mgnify:CR=1 FL=1
MSRLSRLGPIGPTLREAILREGPAFTRFGQQPLKHLAHGMATPAAATARAAQAAAPTAAATVDPAKQVAREVAKALANRPETASKAATVVKKSPKAAKQVAQSAVVKKSPKAAKQVAQSAEDVLKKGKLKKLLPWLLGGLIGGALARGLGGGGQSQEQFDLVPLLRDMYEPAGTPYLRMPPEVYFNMLQADQARTEDILRSILSRPVSPYNIPAQPEQ